MASRLHEIAVTFVGESVFFLNDGGATRVIIGRAVAADGTEITIKGEAGERQLVAGLPYRFYGRLVQHHKYGEQFAFTSFVKETPVTEDAIVAYLKQCHGIGRAVARKIWDAYG